MRVSIHLNIDGQVAAKRTLLHDMLNNDLRQVLAEDSSAPQGPFFIEKPCIESCDFMKVVEAFNHHAPLFAQKSKCAVHSKRHPGQGGIMPSFRIKTILAGVLIAAALPATAQDRPGVTFTVGVGLSSSPDYFGAGSNSISPTGALSVQELVLPNGFGIGTTNALPTDPGFGLRGAFRPISSRKASDNKELRGLNDIDPSVELGLGIFSITQHSRVFGEVRRGFGGHDGWVAEAGVDAILRPTPQWVLTAGPRANWGDREFFNTYFGVTPNEAVRSRYSSFRPGDGLVSLGIEVSARYDFQNRWALQGTMGWDRLQGDAARSPIAKQGDRDQFSARLILLRSFSLGY